MRPPASVASSLVILTVGARRRSRPRSPRTRSPSACGAPRRRSSCCRAQLAEQAQSKVQSRQRNTVELSGLVLVNALLQQRQDEQQRRAAATPTRSSARTATGLPNAQRRRDAPPDPDRADGLGTRAPSAATSSGDLQLDFYGGQQPSAGGRTFPLLRIRTGDVRLDWSHVRLLVGQEKLAHRPAGARSRSRAPASRSSPGPGTSGCGSRRCASTATSAGRVRLGVQAAALAPMQSKAQGPFFTQPDSRRAERRPGAEGRVFLAWGSDETRERDRPGRPPRLDRDVGRLHAAQPRDRRRLPPRHRQPPLPHRGGVRAARRWRVSGGGGIGQDLGTSGAPLRTRGGWVQLDVRPTFAWEFGAGAGMDDPDDRRSGGRTAAARRPAEPRRAPAERRGRGAPDLATRRRTAARRGGAAYRDDVRHRHPCDVSRERVRRCGLLEACSTGRGLP